ncbi:MAG: hypothetical protein WC878_01290 [Candidatus Paceibacterota bacterium]
MAIRSILARIGYDSVYEHPLVGDEWAAIDKDRNLLDHAPTITKLQKKLKKKHLEDKFWCFTFLSDV